MSIGWLPTLMAVWRLGGCAVPIDARYSGFEISILAAAGFDPAP